MILNETEKAITKITTELKNDAGYRESWKANIAMAYKDCERWYKEKTGKKRLNKKDAHIIANDAAEHFLKLLCDEYNASREMNKNVEKGCSNCGHHYNNGMACDAVIRCDDGTEWIPVTNNLNKAFVKRRACKHHFEKIGFFEHTKRWRCKKCGYEKPCV